MERLGFLEEEMVGERQKNGNENFWFGNSDSTSNSEREENKERVGKNDKIGEVDKGFIALLGE